MCSPPQNPWPFLRATHTTKRPDEDRVSTVWRSYGDAPAPTFGPRWTGRILRNCHPNRTPRGVLRDQSGAPRSGLWPSLFAAAAWGRWRGGCQFVVQDGSLDAPRGRGANALVDRQCLPDRDPEGLAEGTARGAARLGREWTDSGRVFTREDGTPLRPAWISVRFDALATRAGLPPITLHGLRHGAATMLLAAGQPPKVVSEILGHATTGFTMDVYTEVAEELADAAAEALSAYIPRAPRKPAGDSG
jgi:hypothetical protein